MLELTFAAARQGRGVMYYADMPESPLTAERVMDRRVDGVVLSGQYGLREWVEALAANELPCVEIGSPHGEWQVHPDNSQGVRLAIDHLLSLGHRRIALWKGPDAALAARERAATFRVEMERARIAVEDSPLLASLEEVERAFTARVRPTALFTYNDNRAVDSLHLFHRLGIRVPEDVSLVGFDNDIRASAVIPGLTTIQNPVSKVSDAAIRLLISQIEGEEAPSTVLRIPTALIVRESTAPPTL
jgi:LacI family transcriptional regulator